MARTTQDHARTATEAHDLLEGAVVERDRCRQRYESSIGTSSEMSAYLRLRRAGERISDCDRQFGELLVTH